MQPRYRTFFVLALMVFIINMMVMRYLYPPQEKPAVKKEDAAAAEAKKAAIEAEIAAGKNQEKGAEPAEKKPAVEPPKVAPQWISMGSVDPASPYRMLVTFNNQGGAIERLELNGSRYHESTWDDLYGPNGRENLGGYLGHLAFTADEANQGLKVNAVGDGTPAAKAGIKVGDTITAINDHPIRTPADLDDFLHTTRMHHKVSITLHGRVDKVDVVLGPRPMQVIRPEGADPLSFLLSMQEIDLKTIDKQLEDLSKRMRTEPWQTKVDAAKDEVEFTWPLPEFDLRIVKRFRLVKPAEADVGNPDAKAYHLEMLIVIVNSGDKPREVAYRLEGPTGLPAEGSWYSSKISTGSGGLRDVAAGTRDGKAVTTTFASTVTVAADENLPEWKGRNMAFAGVDAHYFASAVVVPDDAVGAEDIVDRVLPIRVGPVPVDSKRKSLTDVTCRLIGRRVTVPPGDAGLVNQFQIFAGPKRPALLKKYQLDDLIDYGWFGWVAEPMLAVLHFFYGIVQNYGIAIVMLTVLVRSCMFPISRKQALNAQKMQELQPEIKRIGELYKKDLQARNTAQQELFRKHKYNPLSGCLPMFLQLPIFIGLYRSLSLDVELRQAPLISESVRWCSNLSAPDMFWFWQKYLPDALAAPTGWLGPYLNILPLFTISLFLVQQKMFMPPATDEQTAMQQKIMKYMMIFMGVMFFKVASGLCIYFIASSLWGLAERKLLPKSNIPIVVAPPRSSGRRRLGRS